MNILITGAAGFIGSELCSVLAERDVNLVGLDSINNYYDHTLKEARLEYLGIDSDLIDYNTLIKSNKIPNFNFIKLKLEDKDSLFNLFESHKFDVICHLAAQAGVRYSIENPYAYVDSNIIGFLNILEASRLNNVKHLLYASSSSVYGKNESVPFKETDSIAHPVSLYAATKKANELMAHTYSSLYDLPTTGLRFFTVYGPKGRPDMAPFLFADAISKGKCINVFNNGDMLRDFTYIDDIVEGIVRLIEKPATRDSCWNPKNPNPSSSNVPYRIYNIGNSKPIKLMDFIAAIEKELGIEAIKKYLPMQQGDVYQTNADTSLLEAAVGFKPVTTLDEGVRKFIKWYKEYYKI